MLPRSVGNTGNTNDTNATNRTYGIQALGPRGPVVLIRFAPTTGKSGSSPTKGHYRPSKRANAASSSDRKRAFVLSSANEYAMEFRAIDFSVR